MNKKTVLVGYKVCYRDKSGLIHNKNIKLKDIEEFLENPDIILISKHPREGKRDEKK